MISVPSSELDVLLSGLLFICIVLDRTRELEEEIERKGCREGAEKECREPNIELKCAKSAGSGSLQKISEGGW